ncbi:HypC/HybG/HupF family hydrogenase formation chaperone [Nonomuraea sp. NPDC050153]|uniref:HypC/HybG/HupF family hydrogenase formation chaperone n=1 Tax=Nonomuraea sp. NPDC050153 TaxID=3364359 RepID=UPI0037A7C38E
MSGESRVARGDSGEAVRGDSHAVRGDSDEPVRGASMACDDVGDSCVTCGDVAVAVRVVGLLPGGLARAGTGEGTEEISVALVEARVGDTVLVHAGEAIAVLGRDDR